MTCSIPTTNNSYLKEYIHDQILKDVIEGTLQPNMILHEKKLMEQYGVSRSPVREALIQLCSEGTLAIIPSADTKFLPSQKKKSRTLYISASQSNVHFLCSVVQTSAMKP